MGKRSIPPQAPPARSVDVDDAFLPRLARAFSAARGNESFPPTRPLAALVTAWSSARALSPGSVPAPVVDVDSGLPPWITWAALLAERELGSTLPPASATSEGPFSDDARGRLSAREAAARMLAQAPAARLLEVDVVVRRVEAGRALLTMVLDRTDAGGLFVRITVDAWVPVVAHKGGIVVDDDRVNASAGLREVLSLASHLPAPALLVRAATLPGVVVERLHRGVVGPCTSRWGGPRLGSIHTDDDVDAFALVLSSEELSPDIAVTRDNDVFASDDLPALIAALPKKLAHFRAFRDAKAVVSPSSSALLRARAKARGLHTMLHAL